MGRPVVPMHLDGHRARAVVKHMNAVTALIGHPVIAMLVDEGGYAGWLLPENHRPALDAVIAQIERGGFPHHK